MSFTKNNKFRCDICGKFIGWKDPYYVWAPYGSCLDLDPPDDEHSHKECYEQSDSKNLIYKTSYIKPKLYFRTIEENE